MLEALKQQVYEANMKLVEYGLVIFTWGNVSGIDRESGIFAIKPSGVDYLRLRAEDMVLLDLNMPEKDGIAVIREACLDRMIPVIIITGHYSELLMNRADIPCVYGCLMKPTSEAQVQAAMRRTK